MKIEITEDAGMAAVERGLKYVERTFLERESRRANQKLRKRIYILTTVFICLVVFLGFALADSMDMSEYKSKKIVVYLIIGASFMLVCFVVGLIRTGRTAVNGKNLRLPFKDRTREEAGKIINREVAEGRTQVDEYIYDLPLGKKPYGERVILLPSYLLICHDLGGITAIPRDKIYWLCAQTGRKGQSSYIVRLQIFTELQVFGVDGVEPEYVKGIADKIYQFIPDVFSGYDPFILSYQLEELYNKNRKAFLDLYNDERRKRGEQMTGKEGV